MHQLSDLCGAGLRACFISGLVVLAHLPTDHAFASGAEGHQIVAEIAEQYLTPATAHQIRELLAIQNVTTLAEISIWADQIRLQRPDTAPWHYVNIPIHPPSGTPAAYDHDRDCPHDDCVVVKIE